MLDNEAKLEIPQMPSPLNPFDELNDVPQETSTFDELNAVPKTGMSSFDELNEVSPEGEALPVVEIPELKIKVTPATSFSPPIKRKIDSLDKANIVRMPSQEYNAFFNNLKTYEEEAVVENAPRIMESRRKAGEGKLFETHPYFKTGSLTPEEKKSILKDSSVRPGLSVFEKYMSPIGEAMQESEKEKGVLGTIKGIGRGLKSGFGKLIEGDTEFDTITSDELEAKGVVKIDPNTGEAEVDLRKLTRTLFPVHEQMKTRIQNVLNVGGKAADPEAIQDVMELLKFRGTLSKESEASNLEKALEIMDVMTFGVTSASIVQSKINESGVLKRPEDVTQLDEPSNVQALTKIAEAKKSGKTVEWLSPYGAVPIYPDSTIDSVEDFIYAKQFSDELGNIADSAQSGLGKDIGQILQELGSYGVGKGLMAASKYIKRVPGFEKAFTKATETLPQKNKIMKWLAGIATTVSVAGGGTYAGSLGSDQERKHKAILSAIAGGGLHVGMEGAILGGKSLGKQLKKIMDGSADRKIMRYASEIESKDNWGDLSRSAKKQVREEDFPEVKQKLKENKMVVEDVRALLEDYNQKTGINGRAFEGFKQAMQDPDNPHGKKIVENLNRAEMLHTGRTLEEARIEAALMSTLAEPNMHAKTIDAPMAVPSYKSNTKGEIDLGRHGAIINRYRDLYSNPEELIKVMRKEMPEIAQVFEQRIGLPEFQPEHFYYLRGKDLLNSTLTEKPTTIQKISSIFGNNQVTKAKIAERIATPSKPAAAQAEANKLSNFIVERKAESEMFATRVNKSIDSALTPRVGDEIVSVSPDAADYLNRFGEEMERGEYISKGYAERAIEVYKNILPEKDQLAKVNAFEKNIKEYMQRHAEIGKTTIQLGDILTAENNLNPTSFMAKRAKYLTSDADRVVNRILNNADRPNDNMRFITETYFKDWAIDPVIAEHIDLVITDKMPNFESVEAEIKLLKNILKDPNSQLSRSQRISLGQVVAAFKSYETDLSKYFKGMDAIYDPDVDAVSMLSTARNQLDQIKNPLMARELRNEIDLKRPAYFEHMNNLRADLTYLEQEALWNYLTGDSYMRLKEGVRYYDIVNEDTSSSILKALNFLGRDTIDTYGLMYEIGHNQKLDKNVFHAFFCTPANKFDQNNMFTTETFALAINKKKSLMDSKKGYLAKFMNTFKSYDEMESELANTLKVSSGATMSYLITDSRRARQLIDELFLRDGVTGKGIGIYEEIKNLKSYAHLENPTLVDMIKKHFVTKGYVEGLNIAKFKADGAYELTDFGKFVDEVYRNPALFADLQKKSLAVINELPGSKNDIHSIAASIIDSGKIKVDPNNPQAAYQLANAWAEHLLSYWNFFDKKDAPQMWDMMKDYASYYSKVDAKLMEYDAKITADQNKLYKTMGGAQLIPKVHRDHRVNNMRAPSSGSFFNHPFNAGYEDLRINHMYGTSEYAVAAYADDLPLESVKHPLDNLYSKVWSSVMSSQTAHSRAGLKAYAVGAKHFGFDLQAEWIAETGGLLSAQEVAIENALLSSYINKAKSLGANINNKTLSKVFGGIGEIIVDVNSGLNVMVRPFISLGQAKQVTKNTAQAASFSVVAGDVSALKITDALFSPYKPYIMAPFYNKKGHARYDFVKKAAVQDPAVWGIVEKVIDGYRDVQYREGIGAAMQFAEQGKIGHSPAASGVRNFAAGVTETAVNKMDDLNTVITLNTKERSELYHVAGTLNQGAMIGEKIIKHLKAGEREAAYKLISSSFLDKPTSISEWQLSNFERNLKAGNPNDALNAFLPAYVDQNTGRFGRQVQPQFIQKVARAIPGVGLFYSARNMWAWKAIQNLSNITSSSGIEQKQFLYTAGLMATKAAIVATYFDWMSNGVSTPVADAVLSDETKKRIADYGDEFDIKTTVQKAFKSGITTDDTSGYAGFESPIGLDIKYGKGAENWDKMNTLQRLGSLDVSLNAEKVKADYFLQTLKELSGLGSNKSKQGMDVPIVGFVLEKSIPLAVNVAQCLKLYNETPEHLKGDNEAAVKAEALKEMDLHGLLLKVAGDLEQNGGDLSQMNQALVKKLEELYATEKALSCGKALDKAFAVSPFGVAGDILKNGFTTAFAFKEIYQTLGFDQSLNFMAAKGAQSNKEKQTLEYGKDSGINPLSQYEKLAPFPIHAINKALYEKLGMRKWFTGKDEYEDFRSFVDNIAAMYVNNGIWDKARAEAIKKNAMKQHDILYGTSRREFVKSEEIKKMPIGPGDKEQQEMERKTRVLRGLTP